MKRLPRKYKKKFKKLGIFGTYFYSRKFHNNVLEMINFPSRRELLTIIK